jgi:hypothetical protein
MLIFAFCGAFGQNSDCIWQEGFVLFAGGLKSTFAYVEPAVGYSSLETFCNEI